MIYTDGTHLVSDDIDELHQFAKVVGLKREWFQNHPKHPHYDITTPRMFGKVIDAGAVVLSAKQMLKEFRLNKGRHKS